MLSEIAGFNKGLMIVDSPQVIPRLGGWKRELQKRYVSVPIETCMIF